jgi:hypothetical protein
MRLLTPQPSLSSGKTLEARAPGEVAGGTLERSVKYQRFDELPDLISRKLVTKRPHSALPIYVYNYIVSVQFTPIPEWTEAMKDCRGLILDDTGEIVGCPFRKFWNYEQVTDSIPVEPFTVWEKLDGSLGIICSYAGERLTGQREDDMG